MSGEIRLANVDDDGVLYRRRAGQFTPISPPFQTSSVNINSARLKSLFSNPVELVAAPGAGYAALPFLVTAIHLFATVPYSNRLAPDVYFGDPASSVRFGLFTSISNAFGSSASQLAYGSSSFGNSDLSLIENKSLVFADLQNWTNGDGVALVTVSYTILPVR